MIFNHKFFHWLYYSQKKHPYYNFGTGIFMWLFLALTLPFGMYNNNISSKILLLLFLLPYGLIWPAISYVIDILFNKVFSANSRENYKIDFRLFFLKLFLFVHLAFLVRNIFSGWSDLYLSEYLELWIGSILLVSLVYIPFSLFARYKYFHNMVGQDKNDSADLFELKGEGKSTLKISLDKIIYFKADDNYLDIITLDQEDEPGTIVFRARLKSVENQLSEQSQFFRIHRSYLLNIQYLAGVNKADSLKIKYKSWERDLPVSRQYRKELQNILS